MKPKLITPEMHTTIICASIIIHYLKSQYIMLGHILLSPTTTLSSLSDLGWSYTHTHESFSSCDGSTLRSRHGIFLSLSVPYVFPFPVGISGGENVS